MNWFLMILLAAGGAGIVLAPEPAAYVGLADERANHMIKAIAMVVSMGGTMALGALPRAGIGFKQTASWTAIGLAVISLYSYRDMIITRGMELAGLSEQQQTTVAVNEDSGGSRPHMVAISAMDNGQFSVEALVNRTHVSMLADTGATFVTLTSEDAERAGVNIHALEYSVELRTANGVTHGAIVELDEIDVGGILVRRVAAVVSQPGALHRSLLGMSYFREIGAFELSGDRLVLRE